ncbi:MAG TPA: WD40 repeat domain-containing protein [Blastocatellia bacterium]|nr:WD40 repeat domain-containing protein [Blastocatellia bacterium]
MFSRHDGVIPSVAFSPDGKRLASAGNNWVKITDLETGKELLKLKNSRGMSYFSVAFSPDGRTLAGAQSMLKERTRQRKGDLTITTLIYFGEVLVWDAQTGAVQIRLNDEDGPAWALAFSPDGKWLAVATGPTPEEKNCKGVCPAFGEITLWETGSWKLTRRLRGSSAPIRALAFSPDGQLIAGGAGLMDGGRGPSVEEEFKFEVFLWDVATGELKQKFPGHTNSITSLAFSPDSHLLASAGHDRTLKIWDCRSYELKKMASDQMLSLEEMQTIADSTNAKSGKNAMPPVSWLNSIIFSRDGKHVIGGSGDSIIRFYERESVKIVGVLKPPGWPILRSYALAYDPNIYSSSGQPTIDRQGPIFTRLPGGRGLPVGMMRGRWPFHAGLLNSFALSPDGRTLAIGNSDGKIRLVTLK